jgi:hypothetical protein
MKKVFLVTLAFFAIGMAANAQFQRRTPEERTATIHAKIDSAFKLEPSKLATLDTALVALYKAQDKKMEEMRAGGSMPDRETMMAEMKKYSDAQDEIMKAVLSEDQFKIWKETIQPSMRRPRPAGGGNR